MPGERTREKKDSEGTEPPMPSPEVADLLEVVVPSDGKVIVVLIGDVVELLGYPEATATDILRAHEDLCAALLAVTANGGQVIYAVGNHDGDLAWDVKTADAVREMTGARLCLSADLMLADGRKVRVEHGHQLDP